jgi:hypothetical protein
MPTFPPISAAPPPTLTKDWQWEVTVDVFEGVLEGFFSEFSDLKKCAQDSTSAYENIKDGITDLDSGDASGVKKGLGELGTALDSLRHALPDCKAAAHEIESFGKVVENGFKNPLSFVFHVGKDLIVNGKDIYGEIASSVQLWKQQSYLDSGVQIGKALEKLLVGEETVVV